MTLRYGLGDSVSISTYTGSLGEVGVNTTTNRIHIFDGSTAGGFALAKLSESGGGGSGSLVINKESFTVGAGGSSVFTLTDSYSTEMIDVFVNGVRLAVGDFTETSANVITLTTPADQGDIVEFQSYSTGIGVTNALINNLTVTGITTLGSSNGIGTVTVGIGNTALFVQGNARITGILSVGQGTITLNPNANTITVGTGITINANDGTITVFGSKVADASGNANYSGIVTASSFVGNLTGTATTASTVQPNSVGLGTDTTGPYVQSVTGTANQITVTGGTGEGSTPILSIPNQLTAPQDATVTRDLQVNRNLNVNGNITIGGTAATLFTSELKVYDPDLVLGFRTDANGNDNSTDNTANHGGIAVASTEGNPLVQLYIAGIETTPATYKKFMWFKAGTFSGLGTDAWLSNYAIGIGSTQVPNNARLAVGRVIVGDDDITKVRNITASGTIVGTAGTLIAGIGIQSGGISIATTAKTLNFIGTGNTFAVRGTTVDISIQGGGGGGSGVSSTGILTCRGFANSSVISESIFMNDFYNEGTNYGMIGPIEVSVGATITVGLGVSYAIL